jgi:hypothetical protein
MLNVVVLATIVCVTGSYETGEVRVNSTVAPFEEIKRSAVLAAVSKVATAYSLTAWLVRPTPGLSNWPTSKIVLCVPSVE